MAFWHSIGAIGATVALVSVAAPAWSATITGTVVTADKEAKPVAGATVVAQSSFEWERAFTSPVQTDAAGRFSLTVPDGPEHVEWRKQHGVPVYVYAPGYGIRQASHKEGVPLTIGLSPERSVRGTVRDVAGKPVADVPITLRGILIRAGGSSGYVRVPPPFEPFLSAKTNVEGEWRLGGIPAAADIPDMPGDVSTRTARAYITLTDPRFVRGNRIAPLDDAIPGAAQIAFVARPGGTITGRVLDGDKPVAGVTVVAVNKEPKYDEEKQTDDGRGQAITDANGVFRLAHLGDGTYTVAVSAAKREQVAVAATGIVAKANTETTLPAPLILQSGGILVGRVVSKATGKPVKDASVIAQTIPRVYGDFVPTDTTGEDGTFRLRVAPGDAQVQINSRVPGFVYFDPALVVSVRSGETKTLAPIELPAALSVALHVTDEAGKAVPDLPIRVTHTGWFDGIDWGDIPKTDANGDWDSTKNYYDSLGADDKAPWVVRIPAEWEVVLPVALKLPASAPITVVVRKADLTKRATGRALSPDGKPVPEANVSISSYFKDANGNQSDYQSENLITGKDGRFVLPVLRPNAVVTVRVSKWEYRTTKTGIEKPTLTIPADGKPPQFTDWILTPLSGIVSGKLIGSAGKPVPGAWIWSYDSDNRAVARTDAKGVFTLKHVPPTGTVGLLFAAGRANGMYSATERTGNLLRLEPSKPTPTPQARAAERRRQALRLIAEQAREAEPGQGIRAGEDDRDALAATVAAFDVPTALSLIRQKDSSAKEKHVGGVLVAATTTNPEAARVLFEKERKNWSDPWMIFFRSVEVGMAFATRDPAFATDCYETAKKEIGKGIEEDHAWSLLHLTKLAFRLGTADADRLFTRTVEAATKQFGDANSARGEVIQFAAGGDGVRAAKYIAGLPKETRRDVALRVIEAMLEAQPLEAKKLLEGWVNDGTIKGQNNYLLGSIAPLMAQKIAPFDAEGAAWVARLTPEDTRSRAMLWAASVIMDPSARMKKYREAVDSDRPWDMARRCADGIEVARHTGDTAFVAEMRSALAKSLTTAGSFGGNECEIAARITFLTGDEMPDACRLLLEVSMHQTREMNPENENEIWLIRPALAAMAWIDLPRALQIAEELRTPKAVAEGKREIIRALMTPRDKWQTLVTR